MSILNRIWKNLLESARVPPEYEEIDLSFGNLSVEEVRAIASNIKEQEEWFALDRLVINLYRETASNKLIWIVKYFLESVPEPYVGYQAVIQIDDNTANVIKKNSVLR